MTGAVPPMSDANRTNDRRTSVAWPERPAPKAQERER